MDYDECYQTWRRERAESCFDDPEICDAIMTEVRALADRKRERGRLGTFTGMLRVRAEPTGAAAWLMTGAGAAAGVARLALVAALILGTA